ncbi:MAG TPA: hypothetical protein VL294_09930 [Pseudolysinimonas sp.]|nr:hypothetical protein [Pseudolysinimonas sp.]
MPETDEQPAQWNRVYGDHLDNMGMQLLGTYVPRIEEATEKLRGPYTTVIEPRSSLRLDDRFLGTWRGASLAQGAMGAAVDALQTLKFVAIENGVMPMTALYPLLRAVLESAALAIYLLSPPSRDERLRRSYLVAADDARLRSVYETERGSTSATEKLEEVRAEIRELIGARGTPGEPPAFRFARVEYSDLVAKASAVLDADTAVRIESEMSLLALWQLLSGLSHAKQWAMIEVLERSEAVVNEADASAHVRLTTSPAVIAVFLERALQAIECALRLWGRRSHAWTAEPEDVSEPASVPQVEQRREREERRAAGASDDGEASPTAGDAF